MMADESNFFEGNEGYLLPSKFHLLVISAHQKCNSQHMEKQLLESLKVRIIIIDSYNLNKINYQ